MQETLGCELPWWDFKKFLNLQSQNNLSIYCSTQKSYDQWKELWDDQISSNPYANPPWECRAKCNTSEILIEPFYTQLSDSYSWDRAYGGFKGEDTKNLFAFG